MINSEADDLSDIGHIVHMLREDISNPYCLGVYHTRRLANIPAHRLAKLACGMVDFRVWMDEIPVCILPAVIADVSEWIYSLLSKKKKSQPRSQPTPIVGKICLSIPT